MHTYSFAQHLTSPTGQWQSLSGIIFLTMGVFLPPYFKRLQLQVCALRPVSFYKVKAKTRH